MTPECDLVFTEEDWEARPMKKIVTVLLIPGECTSHDLGQSTQETSVTNVLLKGKKI